MNSPQYPDDKELLGRKAKKAAKEVAAKQAANADGGDDAKAKKENEDILFRLARTEQAMADMVIKLLEVRRKRKEVKDMMEKNKGSSFDVTLPNGVAS